MLLTSQICYVLNVYFSSEVTRQSEDLPTDTVTSKMVWSNIMSAIFIGFYQWGNCSAHWIFAMKYWVISYKLAKGKRILLVNTIYYGVLLLNFLLPVFYSTTTGMNLDVVSSTAFQLVIWIQVLSCLVLFDGGRKIYVFIKKETVSDVNIGYLFFHLTVYVLYLVGLIYYW